MSLASDSVYGLVTQRLAIPPGATQAVLMVPEPGQNSLLLKYFSGGTLEIIGVTAGVTLTAAQLVTASGTGYLIGTSEILSLDGPARFYLSSLGATSVLHVITGRSAGY